MEAPHQLLGADRTACGTLYVNEVDSASAIETTHNVDLANAQRTVAVVPDGEFGSCLFGGCVHLSVWFRLLGRAPGRAPTKGIADSPCGTVPGASRLELHDSRIAVESKVDAGRRLEFALQATRVPRDGDMKALRAYVQLRIVNMAPGMHHSHVAKKALRWREDDQLRVIFPAKSKTASRVTKATWAVIRRRRREGLR